MNFKLLEKLLLLVYKPDEPPSVRRWRPFAASSSIQAIVNEHNQDVVRSYEEWGWTEEQMENLVPKVSILDYDITGASSLRKERFSTIYFIIVHVDSVSRRKKEIDIETFRKEMSVIRNGMLANQHPYYFGIIDSPLDDFMNDYFTGTTKIPFILRKEKELRDYLAKPPDKLRQIYSNLPPSPPPPKLGTAGPYIGTKYYSTSYYKALSTAAIKARNSSITKGLSERDTISLAQKAFDLEMNLCEINENIKTIMDNKILFDSIRSPIFEQLEKNLHQVSVAQKVDLVKVEMVHPHQKFSAGQKRSLNNLGLTDPSISVVQFDRPSLWAEVKKGEGAVKTTKFSAELPTFPSLKAKY